VPRREREDAEEEKKYYFHRLSMELIDAVVKVCSGGF
jgi:hypothetical protein